MKKTISISILVILLSLVVATPQVQAHAQTLPNADYQFMGRMMGSETLSLSEDIEEEMMGEDAHERMEQLMIKFLDGDLSTSEQTEFMQMLNDDTVGPASQMMMTRMMMPNGMQNLGVGTAADYSWMQQMMQNVNQGVTAWAWAFWFTIILVWTVLILAIFALARWLTHKK